METKDIIFFVLGFVLIELASMLFILYIDSVLFIVSMFIVSFIVQVALLKEINTLIEIEKRKYAIVILNKLRKELEM